MHDSPMELEEVTIPVAHIPPMKYFKTNQKLVPLNVIFNLLLPGSSGWGLKISPTPPQIKIIQILPDGHVRPWYQCIGPQPEKPQRNRRRPEHQRRKTLHFAEMKEEKKRGGHHQDGRVRRRWSSKAERGVVVLEFGKPKGSKSLPPERPSALNPLRTSESPSAYLYHNKV